MSSESGGSEFVLWRAEDADVGGLRVRRSLPTRGTRSIGPFVLLDHFGPVANLQDKLPAHPHAGIEVMTYLISGSNEHRDSIGNVSQISSGGAQWMRAGRGVLHSESTLPSDDAFHGLQIWTRLPKPLDDSAPEFSAVQSDDVPKYTEGQSQVRVLSGHAGGKTGPIVTGFQSMMLHATLEPGGELALDVSGASSEVGVYVIEGRVSLTGAQTVRLARGHIASYQRRLTTLRMHNQEASPCQVFVLSGDALPGPVYFGGPFVYDDPQDIRRAQARYLAGRMGRLEGVPF